MKNWRYLLQDLDCSASIVNLSCQYNNVHNYNFTYILILYISWSYIWQMLREKFVSKLGFEHQISSFTHWCPTIGPLIHRYQLRIKPSSHTSTQDSQNVMHTFWESCVEVREEGLILSWYLCLSGPMVGTPMHKTGDLGFKSQLRHKFFS